MYPAAEEPVRLCYRQSAAQIASSVHPKRAQDATLRAGSTWRARRDTTLAENSSVGCEVGPSLVDARRPLRPLLRAAVVGIHVSGAANAAGCVSGFRREGYHPVSCWNPLVTTPIARIATQSANDCTIVDFLCQCSLRWTILETRARRAAQRADIPALSPFTATLLVYTRMSRTATEMP